MQHIIKVTLITLALGSTNITQTGSLPLLGLIGSVVSGSEIVHRICASVASTQATAAKSHAAYTRNEWISNPTDVTWFDKEIAHLEARRQSFNDRLWNIHAPSWKAVILGWVPLFTVSTWLVKKGLEESDQQTIIITSGDDEHSLEIECTLEPAVEYEIVYELE